MAENPSDGRARRSPSTGRAPLPSNGQACRSPRRPSSPPIGRAPLPSDGRARRPLQRPSATPIRWPSSTLPSAAKLILSYVFLPIFSNFKSMASAALTTTCAFTSKALADSRVPARSKAPLAIGLPSLPPPPKRRCMMMQRAAGDHLRESYDEALTRDDVKAIIVKDVGGRFSGGFDISAFGGIQVERSAGFSPCLFINSHIAENVWLNMKKLED